MNTTMFTSEAVTDNLKLPAAITDKRGFAVRWKFSPRHVDNFLLQGMPHFKIGERRVRINVAEADAWMHEKFATRRLGAVATTNNNAGR
jgi:hypothetical protein